MVASVLMRRVLDSLAYCAYSLFRFSIPYIFAPTSVIAVAAARRVNNCLSSQDLLWSGGGGPAS